MNTVSSGKQDGLTTYIYRNWKKNFPSSTRGRRIIKVVLYKKENTFDRQILTFCLTILQRKSTENIEF